jgi:hypothetical protein
MKHRVWWISALLLIFVASGSAKKKSVADFDGGIVRGSHYESSYFKFSYDVPSGWSVFDAEKLRALNLDREQRQDERNRRVIEEAGKHRGNPAYPTSVQSSVGGDLLVAGAMPIVKPDFVPPLGVRAWAREKIGPMSEPEFQAKLLQMVATKVLRAPSKITLAGRKFYRVDIVEPDGKYHSQFTTSIHDYVVGFDLYGRSQEELDALLESMNTVKFE